MVSYKNTLNQVVTELQKYADYLKVPKNQIGRNRTINYPPPFISVLPDDTTPMDAETALGILPVNIVVSVKSGKSIEETQDDIMDLQARILHTLDKSRIKFKWLNTIWEELNSDGTVLDNPLLAIQIELTYDPLIESINE